MKQGAYSLIPGMAGADPNAVGPYSMVSDDLEKEPWYKNSEVQNALLNAGISTGGSLLSYLQQKKANGLQMLGGMNPAASMQGLNTGFAIPGMQQVNSLLGR